MGSGTKTAWQHDARLLSDGDITIFDDGSDPPVESQSRAVTISLDLKTHTATLVSANKHPGPPLLSASQGNAQTLADGNMLVAYGGVPQLSEYSKGGSLLFDAHLPYDMASYRGYRYQWSARPSYPPVAVASLNNTGEETIVHASWNGATGVASWRVLAGKSSGSLKPQATVAASSGSRPRRCCPRPSSAQRLTATATSRCRRWTPRATCSRHREPSPSRPSTQRSLPPRKRGEVTMSQYPALWFENL